MAEKIKENKDSDKSLSKFFEGPVSERAGQTWDPRRYAENARFVSDLGAPVLELLAPRAGERVLDLGCGDGPLTRRLVEAGCQVVGIDSSPEQVASARALGLDARCIDGTALDFHEEFDAVFSNAALHWMRPPDQVARRVLASLRPGGRFVGELGGAGCVAKIRGAIHLALRERGVDPLSVDPWYFPSDLEYRRLLEAAGFVVDKIALIPRPTPLPTDVRGWLETFAGSFFGALAASERSHFLDEVCVALRPLLCDADGKWTADYVRLRFHATKPATAR
jgi:SAM-dependent methyltransferase